MSIAFSAFAAFVAAGGTNITGYGTQNEISAAQAQFDAIEAVKNGEVDFQVEQRGEKQILTACLTKSALRKINKARKNDKAPEVIAQIKAALEQKRPLRVGGMVELTGLPRADVVMGIRVDSESETPTFTSLNDSKSNFHAKYTLASSPEPFPVPVPKEAKPKGKGGRKPKAEKAADAAPTEPAGEVTGS